jgi:hypothetical protein
MTYPREGDLDGIRIQSDAEDQAQVKVFIGGKVAGALQERDEVELDLLATRKVLLVCCRQVIECACFCQQVPHSLISYLTCCAIPLRCAPQ